MPWRRIGEWRYSATHSLTLSLNGGGSQLHAPDALSPRKAPCTHWIESCVGPRAGLDMVSKRKIPSPAWNRTPIVQTVANRYTDWAIRKGEGKFVPVLNQAPHHEDVLGWRYSAAHSRPQHLKEVTGQLHALAALPPEKEPRVPIG
jgi:hypothetical protein